MDDVEKVRQADREAAKSLLGRDDAGPSWWSIDSGNADKDQMVQAFVRRAAQAAADERAAIVAWLREEVAEASAGGDDVLATVLHNRAFAIERGEHMEDRT